MRLMIFAPSTHTLGGVQTWLDYLVPALETKWHVTVALTDGSYHSANHYLRAHPFRNVVRVHNFTGSTAGRRLSIANAVDEVAPDLVLAVNVVDVFPALLEQRYRNRCRAHIALSLHGLHTCYISDLQEFGAGIDGVIATNRLAVAAIERATPVPVGRIYYAPCGVPVVEKLDAIELAAMSAKHVTLLFAGRLDHAEKRILDIPPILRELRDRGIEFSLKIAGSGPDEEPLRRAVGWAGTAVEFLGVLSAEEMARDFYARGAFLVVLSPSETGPMVIWEAMAHGVAVVSSRYLGSGREGSLRHRENCMLFSVGDCENAAQCIADLVADVPLRLCIVRNASRLVKQRYSRESSVRAWSVACERIVNAPKAKRAPLIVPSALGVLDRLLGIERAEFFRRLVRIRFVHGDAGGEWPHSYGPADDSALQQLLVSLDSREESEWQ